MTGSQPSPFPHASVITGGARSGKSALAERLAIAAARPRIYLATAEAGDAEMADRIARHRQDRGPDWTTQEVPHALPAALAGLPPGAVALVDCATLWLTNRMLAGADLTVEAAALGDAIAACPCPVIVVTNEVGWGIVPDNALARAFRDAQGRLNQRLAARADLAVAVIAGLPLVLKGALPPGVA
ncbi:MAG: bifunctional adenosylcobinamide kinase/adenosylcobinamide-phosphate guanylyltransferase [Rhodobacterales bacterium]|nr:bifunctional adenosylcobinamide kinase/adenosylcobinamide-phosphate guanylyltransferase [Rhodobacterales bacterium]